MRPGPCQAAPRSQANGRHGTASTPRRQFPAAPRARPAQAAGTALAGLRSPCHWPTSRRSEAPPRGGRSKAARCHPCHYIPAPCLSAARRAFCFHFPRFLVIGHGCHKHECANPTARPALVLCIWSRVSVHSDQADFGKKLAPTPVGEKPQHREARTPSSSIYRSPGLSQSRQRLPW